MNQSDSIVPKGVLLIKCVSCTGICFMNKCRPSKYLGCCRNEEALVLWEKEAKSHTVNSAAMWIVDPFKKITINSNCKKWSAKPHDSVKESSTLEFIGASSRKLRACQVSSVETASQRVFCSWAGWFDGSSKLWKESVVYLAKCNVLWYVIGGHQLFSQSILRTGVSL